MIRKRNSSNMLGLVFIVCSHLEQGLLEGNSWKFGVTRKEGRVSCVWASILNFQKARRVSSGWYAACFPPIELGRKRGVFKLSENNASRHQVTSNIKKKRRNSLCRKGWRTLPYDRGKTLSLSFRKRKRKDFESFCWSNQDYLAWPTRKFLFPLFSVSDFRFISILFFQIPPTLIKEKTEVSIIRVIVFYTIPYRGFYSLPFHIERNITFLQTDCSRLKLKFS